MCVNNFHRVITRKWNGQELNPLHLNHNASQIQKPTVRSFVLPFLQTFIHIFYSFRREVSNTSRQPVRWSTEWLSCMRTPSPSAPLSATYSRCWHGGQTKTHASPHGSPSTHGWNSGPRTGCKTASSTQCTDHAVAEYNVQSWQQFYL